MRDWVAGLLKSGSNGPLADLGRTRTVPEAAYRMYDHLLALTAVPLRGHPVRRREATRPFFIVGAGRSGTTLCRRILAAHPQIHVTPEARISMAIRVYRRNRHMIWEDLVRVTLGAFSFTREFRDFDFHLLGVYTTLARLPPRERSLARILDEVYRAHGKRHTPGFVHWGDKTPSNARYLSSIHAVFPDCRVIHMVRDGLDVTRSSVRAEVAPDVESAAKRWRTEAMAGHRWVRNHPNQALTVRYERLVSEPTVVAQELCRLLDIPFEPAMLTDIVGVGDICQYSHMTNVFQPITSVNVGKGRDELEGNPKLAAILNPTLVELGYPRV